MADKKLEDRFIPGARRDRFAAVEHAKNAKGALLRLASYFIDEKAMVLAMLAVVIFGTLCGVFAPMFQSAAVDIIAKSSNGVLSTTLIAMTALYILYSTSQFLQNIISARLSQRIVKKLRSSLFGKILNLPVSYLDTHSHGDVMSRMTNDIENISTTISQSLPTMFSGVLTIIGTAVIMIKCCFPLAILSYATVILTVLATKFLSGRVRKFSRHRQALLGKLNGTAEEMIAGYHTVVAYSHQDKTIEEFSETSDRLTKAGIKTDAFSGVMGPVMNCIGNLGFVVISVFGGYFAFNGYISIGIISAFIVYAKQFSRPINDLAQIYGQLQSALAGAERVFSVLDETDEDMSGEEYAGESGCASVSFRNVNFSYVKGIPVLRNFSLDILPGKKVALVGATGSGKTTVVNLLMRFYDIECGTITIDGQDIKDIARPSLRHKIAIVLQDTVLFSDTIRANILYSNENATDDALNEAIEMSRSSHFIKRLPDGLDTRLSSSGDNLSSGQRQLLAIARAFVADPEILILDEATSNVDTRTEKTIQSAMQSIMQGRTSIVIAHRLSTIKDSDVIVVMDKGEIVEEGSHEELLANKGKYYDLYMTQYRGFST